LRGVSALDESVLSNVTYRVPCGALVIENKLDRDKQALYADDARTELDMSTRARVGYAENGALHYAQHIAANSNFRRVFAFGCSGDARRHIIRPMFVDADHYRLLDTVENFSNFSPDRIENYWRQQVLGEAAPEEFAWAVIFKQRDKYAYGYKFNEQRMRRQNILFPVNTVGEPDYSEMEQFMLYLEWQKIHLWLRSKRFELPLSAPCRA